MYEFTPKGLFLLLQAIHVSSSPDYYREELKLHFLHWIAEHKPLGAEMVNVAFRIATKVWTAGMPPIAARFFFFQCAEDLRALEEVVAQEPDWSVHDGGDLGIRIMNCENVWQSIEDASGSDEQVLRLQNTLRDQGFVLLQRKYKPQHDWDPYKNPN